MFIARDKNGNLNLFAFKPSRFLDEFWTMTLWNKQPYRPIDNDMFKNLTWEDEPVEITHCPPCFSELDKFSYSVMEESIEYENNKKLLDDILREDEESENDYENDIDKVWLDNEDYVGSKR